MELPGNEGTGTTTSATATKTATKTAAPAPAAPRSGTLSYFAYHVLRGIGAPITQSNLNFIIAWANREGGGGAFNPLNTSLRVSGSTSFNKVGVQNYSNLDMGIAATVKTLLGKGRYNDIVGALKNGTASPTQNYRGLGTWSGYVPGKSGYTNLAGIAPRDSMVQASSLGLSGTTQESLPSSASWAQIKADVEKNYGYMAPFLSIPDVQNVLIGAVRGGYYDNPQMLQSALGKTTWWKTHSDTVRTFMSNGYLDPASQQQQIKQSIADVTQTARQMGLVIDPKRIAQIATDSLRFGWDGTQLKTAMVSEGKFNLTGKMGGDAAKQVADLKQTADQYLVPLDQGTLLKWVKDIESGNVNPDQFEAYAKAQAKSLFPTLAGAIDQGVTVRQYVNPYATVAVNNGVAGDVNDINWMDPKWQQALFQVDPKTGQRTAMSLADWQTKIRTDAAFGYDKTGQALSAQADLGQQLSQLAGAS